MSILNAKTIPSTVVATSDPPQIVHFGAQALFPIDGVNFELPVGLQLSGSLLHVAHRVLHNTWDLDVAYNLFFGAAGPGWGNRIQVQGVYGDYSVGENQRAIFLSTQGDFLQAGFLMGANLGLSISASLSTWFHSVSFSLNVGLDFIGIGFFIIQLVLGASNPLSKTGSFTNGLLGSYGMLGTSNDSFTQNQGTISVEPVLNIGLSIWSVMVVIDETSGSFGGAVAATNVILDATASSIGLGPQFGIGLPTTFTMKAITLDNVTFDGLAFGDNTVTGVTTQALPSAPTTLGFTYEHNPHFDFLVGAFINISLFQLISFGVSYDFSLLQAIGWDFSLGSYTQTVKSSLEMAQVQESWEVEFA